MAAEMTPTKGHKPRKSSLAGLGIASPIGLVQWKGLRFEVPSKRTPLDIVRRVPQTQKVILSDVSGMAEAGKLTAIMGPSGVSARACATDEMRKMLTKHVAGDSRARRRCLTCLQARCSTLQAQF